MKKFILILSFCFLGLMTDSKETPLTKEEETLRFKKDLQKQQISKREVDFFIDLKEAVDSDTIKNLNNN